MRRCLLILMCMMSGCSITPSENMRMDLGCRVIRNPKSERIEHFHCDRRLPIQFEYRF